MTKISEFTVTCNECGSNNVELSASCGQNVGFAYLDCNDCGNEEESN